MNALTNAVAVVFPGVDTTDVVNASVTHTANVLIKEPFNPSKDYTKFFKRSRKLITTDLMNLLFIYPDGSSVMVQDLVALKNALKKAAIANGAFA
ncbi:MAG: hypothetical protein BGO70_04565 [Bacteroidetes bacterium 43-93]|nr:hypothetical protein [Bacteroidota bacterium]OJX00044.1 MAG: hypothetical protein BGO70_04565 [Bacteroidetes bacterium 43-93]